MARYAYIRLDEIDRDSTRQALLLDTIGNFDRIFVDNIPGGQHIDVQDSNLDMSWKKYDKLGRLLKGLAKGDCLFVASVDRICESAREFIAFVKEVQLAGADFVCLDISFDTRSETSLAGLRMIEKLDEVEFEAISRKKKMGIERARQKGRRIGRPPVSLPAGFRQICKNWEEGLISGPEAIQKSGMKSTSFYKKARELGFKRSRGGKSSQ